MGILITTVSPHSMKRSLHVILRAEKGVREDQSWCPIETQRLRIRNCLSGTACIGIEQRLAIHGIRSYRSLSFRRGDEIHEGPCGFFFYVLLPFGVNEDYTVLVKQLGVALNQQIEIGAVFKSEPRCAI